MPVPSVEEWAWLNGKFSRPVQGGDTIYARWTLTQKRPPIGAAPNSIVVWRVDVMTADGELCAEGEVGAKVRRHLASRDRDRPQEPAASAASASAAGAASPRRRSRRPPARAHGPLAHPPPAPPPPRPPPNPQTTPGPPNRHRPPRPSRAAPS